MAKIRPKDWTPEEKTSIVLALLAGTPISELARTHGVSETSIYNWRDVFVQAGQAQLATGRKKSQLHPVEEENHQLKQTLAETVLKLELQKETGGAQEMTYQDLEAARVEAGLGVNRFLRLTGVPNAVGVHPTENRKSSTALLIKFHGITRPGTPGTTAAT